jgi:hypothetical protein
MGMHQWDGAIEGNWRGGKILKDIGVIEAVWVCEYWIVACG